MGGDNEQLKADLKTGADKFSAAATNLQTIKDAVDSRIQRLSPQEQKWIGDASSEFQQTLTSFSTFSLDAIGAMQDTSSALTKLKEAIEEAERQAEEELEKERIAGIVILVLGVVLLPVAGSAVGGTLAEGSAGSGALKFLRDVDNKIAGIFEAITKNAKNIFKAFKTDLPEAETIKPIEIETIEPKLPGDVVPPSKVSEPVPTPQTESGPIKTPEETPAVDTSYTPKGGPDEYPLKTPEETHPVDTPYTPKGGPDEPPQTLEAVEKPNPADGGKPANEPQPRPDSGFFDGPAPELPGKPGDAPTALPKEIAPQEPITVFLGETKTPVKSETTSSSSSEVQVVDTYADGSTTTTTTYLPGEPLETTTIIERDPDGSITSITTRNPDGSETITRPTPSGPSSVTVRPPEPPVYQPTGSFKPKEGPSGTKQSPDVPDNVPDSPLTSPEYSPEYSPVDSPLTSPEYSPVDSPLTSPEYSPVDSPTPSDSSYEPFSSDSSTTPTTNGSPTSSSSPSEPSTPSSEATESSASFPKSTSGSSSESSPTSTSDSSSEGDGSSMLDTPTHSPTPELTPDSGNPDDLGPITPPEGVNPIDINPRETDSSDFSATSPEPNSPEDSPFAESPKQVHFGDDQTTTFSKKDPPSAVEGSGPSTEAQPGPSVLKQPPPPEPGTVIDPIITEEGGLTDISVVNGETMTTSTYDNNGDLVSVMLSYWDEDLEMWVPYRETTEDGKQYFFPTEEPPPDGPSGSKRPRPDDDDPSQGPRPKKGKAKDF